MGVADIHGGCGANNKRKRLVMYGICDVPGCKGVVSLGWRPLTEQHGRQVCEEHWRRHKDPQDGFDLFKVFSFKKSARPSRLTANEDVA